MSHGQYLLRRLLACVLLLMFGLVPLKAMAATPQLAHGVIVKLKERGSVVTPALQGNPSRWSFDSSTRQHMRLVSAAWRQGVQFDSIKRSAFAAHVLRTKQPIPLAQAEAFAKRLAQDADVEWALPNAIEKAATVGAPNDPYYAVQSWLYPRVSDTRGVADFPLAWNRLYGLSLNPVVVAVLDSGVPGGHEDLDNQLLPGYDFVSDVENARDDNGLDSDASDPGNWLSPGEIASNPVYYSGCRPHDSSWHGLAIAGMLAARTNNWVGGAGMLWQLRSTPSNPFLLPVRIAGACGAEVSDIIEGMLWAAGVAYQGSPRLNANPARVINLSFGGDGACTGNLQAGSPSWMYVQAVQALRRQGVLVVASAGNGGSDEIGLPTPTRPANCPGVLAVTGLHVNGFKASFANLLVGVPDGIAVMSGETLGSSQALDSVITTWHDGLTDLSSGSFTYGGMIGTSFSAPMVAGTAAMMLAVNPALSVDQLVEGLKVSAMPFLTQSEAAANGLPSNLPQCDESSASTRGQCYCTTRTCGAGILNAPQAIDYALATTGDRVVGTPETATFFTPDRLATTSTRGSSSGGGAMDLASLVFISMLLGLTLLAAGKR